ncbi:glycosyltransferase family protein [Vibrio kanaloae]|uniref:glycosyltransferase family 4 protein n=1 Tax=Vibrio kanaloae TaxID=170673 RepID=UPI0011B3EC97|nr:glycosyltransferase family 4 protein [Vibrio kanaloae]
MKIALLCDHSLDPRLRKRVRWLINSGHEVTIFTDSSRGQHFSNTDFKENDVHSLNFKKAKSFDCFYISGAKVIIQKLLLFFQLKIYNKDMIYEIPDLPLRSKIKFVNYFNLTLFAALVRILFSKVVVTSNSFIKHLPSNKNYYLCENLPSAIGFSDDFSAPNSSDELIRFGFVGALRYPEQMLMLIRYCTETGHKADFFGGPEESIEKLKLICGKAGVEIKENINFHGSFDQSQLEIIYRNIDFVFSVYDANQPNVQLALPNKLYESQLFETPIIVAKNTYLSEVVSDLEIGFSVDALNYSTFSRDMDIGSQKGYEISKGNVIKSIEQAENSFIRWFEEVNL